VHFTQAERFVQAPIASPLAAPPKTVDAGTGISATSWKTVPLPNVAFTRSAGEALTSEHQIAWYRFELNSVQQAYAGGLFFYLPRWQTVGQVEVYGDGRLLWRSEGDPVWNAFNQPVWVDLDPPGQTRPHVLLLRMDSVPGLGGGISSAWIGTEDALRWRYQIRKGMQSDVLLAASVAFGVLGLFALSVWWRRRHESLYLLCFFASMCFVARYTHLIGPLNTSLISSAWFGWITVNSMSWLITVILLFNYRLCGKTYRWLEYGMFACIAVHGLLTLPWLASSAGIASLAIYAYLILTFFAAPASVLSMYASWKARSAPALVVASIGMVGFPLAVHDMMLQNYQLNLEQLYLLPVAQVGFCIMFAIIIQQRYISGIDSLERSHEILAQRLLERETELEESHARLREIEQREVLSRERQRLMQDMHDGLGGSLTSVMRMMEHGQSDQERIRTALQDCMDELRLTIDSLEPVESDISVLLANLRFRLQPRLEAAGIQLQWRVEALPPLPWLTPAHAMHVMRIVQEVVTNIIKHAHAGSLVFTTDADGGHACICIDDNGRGFDGQSLSDGRRGLGNIAHRADILGATATWILHAPAPGTRFCLRLPLKQSAN